MNIELSQFNTKYYIPLIILSILALTGCSSTPRPPTYLMPSYGVSKGYKALGSRATFEKDNLIISLKTLSPEDEVEGKIFSAIKENNYIFMELTFMNKSDKRVTYNTSFTSLRGAQFDYRKPLNYTDLYSIAVGKSHDLTKEKDLKGLKGTYYDHMTRIKSKETVTMYLIFRPNAKETYNAVLMMGEIYMGTKTFSVVFPFETMDIEAPPMESETEISKENP